METKRCLGCQADLPLDQFYTGVRDSPGHARSYSSSRCRPCHVLDVHERNRRKREEAIRHYGGQCACCGETELDFLVFDHIDGGGNAHRKTTGVGYQTFLWIVRNGYPPIFQVLCANCNMAKERKDGCPHQRITRS